MAFFVGDLEGLARVGGVDEAGKGLVTELEEGGVAGADFPHFLFGDLAVEQGGTPVGGALEDGEGFGGLGDLLDGLHASGAGADDGDTLAFEADRFVRPAGGVAGLAPKGFHAWNGGHGGGGEGADGGDEEARSEGDAVFEGDGPGAGIVVVVGSFHAAAELDVAAEVEFVGDVVEVAEGFGLGGEVFVPVPLVEQFLGEGELVGAGF